MKPINKSLVLAVLASALALLSSGCGGVNASHSVSPASLLIPGLLKVTPPPVHPAAPAVIPVPDVADEAALLVRAN